MPPHINKSLRHQNIPQDKFLCGCLCSLPLLVILSNLVLSLILFPPPVCSASHRDSSLSDTACPSCLVFLIGPEEMIVLYCYRLIFCHWPRCPGQPLTPSDNVAYPITCRMRPCNPAGGSDYERTGKWFCCCDWWWWTCVWLGWAGSWGPGMPLSTAFKKPMPVLAVNQKV